MSTGNVFLFPVLLGMVFMNPLPAQADEADVGTHELAGPVQVLWEARDNSSVTTGVIRWISGSLAVSPDGSTVFATGQVGLGDAADYATLAYHAGTGEQIWSVRYDGPASRVDAAESIAVSPDGSTVFVTGYSRGLGTGPDYATLAYDAATGEQVWSARYDGPHSRTDAAESLAVSPDGSTVFVTGRSGGFLINPWDYATVAYDAATGEQVWSVRHNGPGTSLGGFTPAASLDVSPDGSTVFVSGSSFRFPQRNDYITLAFDAATGEQTWSARYDGPPSYTDLGSSLAVSSDGSTVFVSGFSVNTEEEGWDYTTLAYDGETGEQSWIAHYGGSSSSIDRARSIAVSPDGSAVFVTGESAEDLNERYDYVTLRYDAATGEQVWRARYDGPGLDADFATSLALSPDGSTVIVHGSSTGTEGGLDYATLAYDAETGEQVWSARYDGPASDRDLARSIAVSPDGSTVFVSGYSKGVETSDFATVAYSLVRYVAIDIRPRSINPGSRGVIPVALLGSDEFNVSDMDVATLRFGPDEGACRHDLTDPFTFSEHLKDMNLDGNMDLMLHFNTQDTGILCGETEATLWGVLLGGSPFEGTDSLQTVGCKSSSR
ncbi:MAG: PQQ-binding-like beta-propeller repeat protein [Acidobacteriota bacterium]|nr:PQQ-binding-like beta-propeller repeat protein [Acidobacteriota bacterium]MDH3784838.1 PQQ-binding-like beta-propeller repeat protein [Acidobacteriota bacterium]